MTDIYLINRDFSLSFYTPGIASLAIRNDVSIITAISSRSPLVETSILYPVILLGVNTVLIATEIFYRNVEDR